MSTRNPKRHQGPMLTLVRYLPRSSNARTLAVLLSGTAYLSWRYYTSAAFEYPVVFSLFTLIGCAVASTLRVAWNTRRRMRLRTLVAVMSRDAPPRSRWWWPSMVAFVVGRTLLLVSILGNVQCSIDGVYLFLPALIALLDVAFPTFRPVSEPALSSYNEFPEAPPRTPNPSSPSHLSNSNDELLLKKRATSSSMHNGGAVTRIALARYVTLALVWGFLASQTLVLMLRPVGAICPSYYGWDFGRLVPAGQMLMLVLDTVVIVQVAKIQRFCNNQSNTITDTNSSSSTGCSSVWATLGILSFSSAVVLTAVTLGIFGPGNLFNWAPPVQKLVLRDLICESAVATAVLIAAVSLMTSAHPATLAAITGAVGLFVHYVKQVKDEKHVLAAPMHAGWWEAGNVGFLAIASSLFLVWSERWLPNSPHHSSPAPAWTRQRWLTLCYLGFLITLLIGRPDYSPRHTAAVVSQVIDGAQKASIKWIQNAARSRSLPEAVMEYQLRYGIPPPPHFDKWYAFAVEHNSPVIDSFDQIHNDLLPFWGIPPALLREQTTHLLEQTHLGIGGFRIKNHAVTLSPLTPGTHFWMMEGFKAMVEPFLEWLPDMDLAFNLDDECRVVVPFDEMQRLNDSALEARNRLRLHGAANSSNSFSTELTPPWGDSYMADGFTEAHANDKLHPNFSIRHPRHSIFDLFVAPTCPPSSPARTSRWWSRREGLPSGRGIVTLTEPGAAVGLCQRPDIARMHGFLLDPGAFGVTTSLLPIFSQGRIPSFSDILVPSPWNFRTKVDIDDPTDHPWDAKSNSVFWRGASSDGLSRGTSSWTGFLRARFVWLSRRLASLRHTQDTQQDDLTLDVSFVGNFTKCHRAECLAQATAFYGAPEVSNPPAGVDFQEHWSHRHLVDLDGAGFSGRFIPFLKSRSLVYRASLFRTWYDERVHAWHHYIPLDISLVVDLWELVKLLVARGSGVHGEGRGGELEYGDDDGDGDGDGDMSAGEKIALDGRDWARKALRKEDMQVYMFRLLLEWARLVDDRREELGFEMG